MFLYHHNRAQIPYRVLSLSIRYLKQIEATLQVIELWATSSVPDFDNETMLIAIEQVSDLIRLNLLDLERNEIISNNAAMVFRNRAVRLVPSLLLKLNNEKAYRARELEQQSMVMSKQKHLDGLSRSVQIFKFSKCYMNNITEVCNNMAKKLSLHLRWYEFTYSTCLPVIQQTYILKVNNPFSSLIELEKMSHVWPCELVDCLTPSKIFRRSVNSGSTTTSNSKQSGSNTSFASSNQSTGSSYMHPPASLEAYISWFNRLSYFSCSSVLLVNPKSRKWTKKCADILTFFIDTAVMCAEMGNFNSALAIALGLTLDPVTRLTKVWQKVDQAKVKILHHIINPDGNFKNYRTIFKGISEKFFNDDSLMIPFFSLFVKDIYFLGNMVLNKSEIKRKEIAGRVWNENMKELCLPIKTFRCLGMVYSIFLSNSRIQIRVIFYE